ncbi:hypothetical protein [Aliidiomarina soli]|uniref:Uncharacterized protein n=1 Tax=Aliidiomarina soli TaxID=1928574 RepID=A0A432WCW2_9GAMM|nr:hypothetical protein [Aliidiomarina soli]RUO30240.1 hypothetical protein CWE14_12735 [Aliidiomarina soli]
MTYSELELAYMLVSAKGSGLDVNAFIERANGAIHIDNIELNDGDEIPADLDDATKYVRVPAQDDLLNEFELMGLLVERQLSEQEQAEFAQTTQDCTAQAAVRAGIHYLNSIGKLAAWRQLVTTAQERALRNWAEKEGLGL